MNDEILFHIEERESEGDQTVVLHFLAKLLAVGSGHAPFCCASHHSDEAAG